MSLFATIFVNHKAYIVVFFILIKTKQNTYKGLKLNNKFAVIGNLAQDLTSVQ